MNSVDIENAIASLFKDLHERLGREYALDSTISVRRVPKDEDYHFSRVVIEMKSDETVMAAEQGAAGTRTVNTTTVLDYLPITDE